MCVESWEEGRPSAYWQIASTPSPVPPKNGVEPYPILSILISEGRVINENICKYWKLQGMMGKNAELGALVPDISTSN